MTGDGEKYHYLAVTGLSALLQRISSNHKEDFYCLNCFNSYTTKNKLKEHEEICNNHDSCRVEMPNSVNKMLEHKPVEKSLKAPFVFYISSLNKPKKSYTEKKARHEPSGWSIFIRCSFDKKENKLNYYRGKDCIENVRKNLKESAMKIIDYEKKK